MQKLTLRLRWALKVLRAKRFAVLTEKESFLYFNGVDPNDLDDALSVTGQRQALDEFTRSLKEVISQHDQRLDYILEKHEGGKNEKAKTADSTDGKPS